MYLNPGEPTQDVVAALETARAAAAAGHPVFLARPATENDTERQRKTGFVLPSEWEKTLPDPSVVDHWRPGMALCMVMGHGVDLLDIDLRSGGALPDGFTPPMSYGSAMTPSGGVHSFVRSLGVGSRDAVFPGVDVKGGMADGTSRGFAFIAPTVKVSKTTGELVPYRWITPLDVVHAQVSTADVSGAPLAAAITALRARSAAPRVAGESTPWLEFLAQKESQSTQSADAAISRALTEVRESSAVSGTGFRTTLMRCSMTLGGYVGAGHLDEDRAFELMHDAVTEVFAGGPDGDDLLWMRQGIEDGKLRPFRVHTAADTLAGPVAQGQERPWTVYEALGAHPFDPVGDGSDQGLADAVLARMAPALRVAVDTGGWVQRRPDRWVETEDQAEWAVSVLARLMPPGARPVPKDVSERTPEHWQAVRLDRFKAAAGSGSVAKKIKAVARGHDHHGVVRIAELDNDPEILWAGGVPWDLRNSTHEPKPADLDPATPHLHTAAVAPDSSVLTPVWDNYLATVWPDAEIKAWALRVLSVALTGYPDAALPILHGDERTGKSATVDLLCRLLGTYGHAADPRILGGTDTHASVIYALKGRRISFIDEGPRRGHLAAERLKQITGGAMLTGNAMRSNPITFAPTHTLVMTMNGDPDITDPALRARVRAIPCYSDRDAVRGARQALTAAVWEREAPGILAAMMRETGEWLADRDSALNQSAPATLRERMDEMEAQQNPVGEWVSECTVPADPGTPGRELFHAFAEWWDTKALYRRMSVPTETAFGRSLTDLGYPAQRGGRFWMRPLSIMGGRGGLMPWEPMQLRVPSPALSSGDVTGDLRGSDAGSSGSDAGSEAEPATPETPTSEFNREDALAGLAGFEQSSHKTTTTTHIAIGGIGAKPATRAASAPNSRVTRENTTMRGSDSEPATRAQTASQRKKEENAQRKRQFVTECEGPSLGLPAAMRRGEEPRSVTIEEVSEILEEVLVRSGGKLAVDVETSAFPIGHPDYRLRTIQLGDLVEGVDLDAADTTHQFVARKFLAAATELNAHSATADLAPLAHLGLIDYDEAFSRMVDTAVLGKLDDPAGTANSAGLKDLAQREFGPHAVSPGAEEAKNALFKAMGCIAEVKPDTPITKNGWARVDSGCATMVRYAISDVLDCSALRLKLPEPEAAVLVRERRVQAITGRTTFRGIRLDSEAVSGQIRTRTPEAARLGELVRSGGIDNANSPTQVARGFEAIGVPLPNTTKDTLTKVTIAMPGTPAGELAANVMGYRKESKFLSSFLHPWSEAIEHGDGRVRPTIYTLGADTGRMSCVRPNAQQIPKKGGARECWAADEGYVFVPADFSSVEVRVIAALSQDPTLIQMLHNGLKLHDEIAKVVFGPAYNETQRGFAKNGVFASFFGAGIERIALTIKSDERTAKAVVDAIGVVAPGVKAWTERVKADVRHGMSEFRTYSGRVIKLDPKQSHKAVNYQVQGTAREILVDGLIDWDDGEWAGSLVIPVHDEILAMVPEADGQRASVYLQQCMTREINGVKITCEPDPPSPVWVSAKD